MEYKRGLLILLSLFIIIIFLISYVYAAEPITQNQSKPDKSTSEVLNEGKENLKQFIEYSVPIPDYLKMPAKVILGIKEEIKFSYFIILIFLWIALFGIIYYITDMIPFFKGKLIRIIVSLIITAIASISGELLRFSYFFVDLNNSLAILKKWGYAYILIGLVIIVFIIYCLKKFSNYLKKKAAFEAKYKSGLQGG
jgi:Na+-transporting methylmalonyl-CoA/oxaloacetate decarboxylase gamma subunit